MSDDRISESPNPPRCPVCATGFASSPGASCPACGHVFASLSVSPLDSDFRLKTERFRFDGPRWEYFGYLLVIVVFFLAVLAPGLYCVLGILLLPALIRMARLSRGREYEPARMLSAFVAAMGVSILMAVVAGTAGVGVLIVTFNSGPGFSMVYRAVILGWVTTLVVFTALFVAFWPRADTSSKYDPGED